jgi:Family of unknown function (DUF5985)
VSDLFRTLVYLLCFATSGACAYLLARNYVRTRAPLLLWSALCFGLLAANNFVVVLDLLVFPQTSFGLLRPLLALSAVMVLLYGFVWDMEE